MKKALWTLVTCAVAGALIKGCMAWSAAYGLPDSARTNAIGRAALIGALIGGLFGLLGWARASRAARAPQSTRATPATSEEQDAPAVDVVPTRARRFLDPQSNLDSVKGCGVFVVAFVIVMLAIALLGWLNHWW
jgi:hypothetical protein